MGKARCLASIAISPIFIFLLTPARALAQYSLGQISSVVSEACPAVVGGDPADWVTQTSGGTDVQTTCYHAEITCPETADMGVTYGVATPAGASNGMIAFVPSKFGTFTLPGNFKGEIPFDLYHDNFQTVQFAFDSQWQVSGTTTGSIKVSACRVATVLQYLYANYFLMNASNTATAGMCAHSLSGGAGGLAFAMTYYGVGSFLDKAGFVSGPQYGDLVEGCIPPMHAPVDICPTADGVYAMGCNSAAGTWTDRPNYIEKTASNISVELANDPPCSEKTHHYTESDRSILAATSVVDGLPDASYTYPNTAVSAYLCDLQLRGQQCTYSELLPDGEPRLRMRAGNRCRRIRLQWIDLPSLHGSAQCHLHLRRKDMQRRRHAIVLDARLRRSRLHRRGQWLHQSARRSGCTEATEALSGERHFTRSGLRELRGFLCVPGGYES
jgi:hypothetical protein